MMKEEISSKLSELLEKADIAPKELATMVAEFYKELVKQGTDEAWARKLTEIYLSGL